MKKFLLFLIIPLLFGITFVACEPIEEGDLPPIEEQPLD